MKEYQIKVRVPLGAFSNAVKELESSVNASLAEFGLVDTISVTSIVPMKLTVARKLTEKEEQEITQMVELEFIGKFGKADVVSFELITPDTREECDCSLYPAESGWSIHQPQHCSNCGQDL